jgi:3-isopropylmalate/(R)-2-methylmalate dehydratase large subunit
VIDAFSEIEGASVFDPSKAAVVLDHLSPAPSYDAAMRHQKMRNFAQKHGLKLYGPGEGICHQLVMENVHAFPGSLVAATDSHACSYGASNALGVSVGATEAAVILASGACWFKVPETVAVELTGNLRHGVTSKDVSLEILSVLKEEGGAYKSLEFRGDGLSSLSVESRMVICNMASEVGVKDAIFPCDGVLRSWLGEKGVHDAAGFSPDNDAFYSKTVKIDLDSLTPKAARSPSIDDVVDVEEMAGIPINQVIIGSCTNGRYEDFALAAEFLRGKRISDSVKMILTPASRAVLDRMSKDGTFSVFLDAGAMILPPCCGPCTGLHGGLLGDGEVALSTTSRNVRGRMGSKKADIHIVSPATAAISAVEGKITSPLERG